MHTQVNLGGKVRVFVQRRVHTAAQALFGSFQRVPVYEAQLYTHLFSHVAFKVSPLCRKTACWSADQPGDAAGEAWSGGTNHNTRHGTSILISDNPHHHHILRPLCSFQTIRSSDDLDFPASLFYYLPSGPIRRTDWGAERFWGWKALRGFPEEPHKGSSLILHPGSSLSAWLKLRPDPVMVSTPANPPEPGSFPDFWVHTAAGHVTGSFFFCQDVGEPVNASWACVRFWCSVRKMYVSRGRVCRG